MKLPHQIAGALGLALLLAGCSQPPEPDAPPAATVRLSTGNADSNGAAIAAFVRKTCLDAVNDPAAFDDAVEAAGWGAEVDPAAGGGALTIWQLEHGALVYSAIPIEVAGSRMRDCQVTLDAAVAPTIERMRAALAPLVRHQTLRLRAEPTRIVWQWRPSQLEERVLTLAPAPTRPGRAGVPGRQTLSIHVATTEIDPSRFQAELGNVQAEPANAQAEPVNVQ
ncbi:MAG TPA: hypothetical protein VJS15_05695 [Allosphingosinicella sp.]|nr:hypothetical protein [Allosphingosinicella sp.]